MWTASCGVLPSPIQSMDDVDLAFAISEDGSCWIPPIDVDISDPVLLVFNFGFDVSGAGLWRVPTPTNWNFPIGEQLGEPLAGTIG